MVGPHVSSTGPQRELSTEPYQLWVLQYVSHPQHETQGNPHHNSLVSICISLLLLLFTVHNALHTCLFFSLPLSDDCALHASLEL